MESMTKRVKTGARLLDAVRPGWEREISLKTLDLGDGRSCVLGQLYGSYHIGVGYLGLNSAEAEKNGFLIQFQQRPQVGYRTLTEQWKREIKRRRG